MRTSEQLDQLGQALCKAQKSVMRASLDGKNPFFKSKYSTLDSVWEACREPLTENGLCVIQLPGPNNTLETTILHESGQFISSEYTLKPVKDDPQALGSALSYARRYALASAVGVVSKDDDDGNAAARQVNNDPPGFHQNNDYPITEPQRKRLFAIIHSNKWTEEQAKDVMKKSFNIDSSKDLKKNNYDTLCNIIESKSYQEAVNELI